MPPIKWQRPPPRESNCSRNIGSLLLLLTTHLHRSGSTNAVLLQVVGGDLEVFGGHGPNTPQKAPLVEALGAG